MKLKFGVQVSTPVLAGVKPVKNNLISPVLDINKIILKSQYYDQNSNSFFAPLIRDCIIHLSLILLLLLTLVITFKRIYNSTKINEYDLLFQDQENALQ